MNKTLVIFRHELLTTIGRKSFLFAAFGVPLIAGLIMLGVTAINREKPASSGEQAKASQQSETEVEGYVDRSGIIQEIPNSVPPGHLAEYPSEDAVRQALRAGEVSAYYIVPSDYVESGNLIYVNPKYRFSGNRGQSWVMRQTLTANLLGNDPERLERFWNPMETWATALAPVQEKRDDDNPLTFSIPYATTMIFYIVIIMAASLLLNSVGEEKKNRVMEILVLSVTPRQMLTGKIIALGIAGLVQIVAWVGTGYALLRLGGTTLQVPPEMQIPPSFLAWALVFFLLGYAVYASLMAGLGALAPNLKESSQAVILILWPLITPLFVISIMIEQPNGPLATGLSLFPLTAPTVMMMRLSVGKVPLWQPLLAGCLMLLTATLIIRGVAQVFRAQTLLSGQPVTPKRFYLALLGRQ